MIFNIRHALFNLRPGAHWLVRDDDYAHLEWYDENQTKPTEEEIGVEIQRLQSEYDANKYQRDRAAEYPPMADYLDAVVKNDTEQLQAYIDACLAVKAKYPKPE